MNHQDIVQLEQNGLIDHEEALQIEQWLREHPEMQTPCRCPDCLYRLRCSRILAKDGGTVVSTCSLAMYAKVPLPTKHVQN